MLEKYLYDIQLESVKMYIQDLKNIDLLQEEMHKLNCTNENEFLKCLMQQETSEKFIIANYGIQELDRIKKLIVGD